MRIIALLLTLSIFAACSTKEDRAGAAIKKHFEDLAFKNNEDLKIMELKIIKAAQVPSDSFYNEQIRLYKNMESLYTWLASDSSMLERYQQVAIGYAKLDMMDKADEVWDEQVTYRRRLKGYIDTSSIYSRLSDSLSRLKGVKKENFIYVKYFMKAQRPGNNILDTGEMYFNKDWQLKPIYVELP